MKYATVTKRIGVILQWDNAKFHSVNEYQDKIKSFGFGGFTLPSLLVKPYILKLSSFTTTRTFSFRFPAFRNKRKKTFIDVGRKNLILYWMTFVTNKRNFNRDQFSWIVKNDRILNICSSYEYCILLFVSDGSPTTDFINILS